MRAPSRTQLAYLTYPVFMGGFMWLAWTCSQRGFDPGVWIPGLTALSFVVILGLEQVLPLRRETSTLRDWQSLNDIGHGVLTGLLRPVGTSLGVLAVAWLSEARDGSGWGALWPSGWSLVPQLIFAHLLVSFVSYWVHRSLHEVDRLWWFHAVHHDTGQVHVLKSGRFHFVDEIYSAIITPLPLLLLGTPTEVVVLRSMWSVFNGSLSHANVQQRFPDWFHYVISTVQVHNLHHSSTRRFQDSNYAGAPIWDVLFGTFSHPAKCQPGGFGLAGDYMPRNFFAQLWFPFRAQLKNPAAEPEPATNGPLAA